MEDPALELEVELRLRELGLSRRYLGYDYLVYMLCLARRDPSLLEAPTKLLYPAAARRFGTTVSAVDSAVRVAARVCSRRPGAKAPGPGGAGGPPTACAFLRRLAATGDAAGR